MAGREADGTRREIKRLLAFMGMNAELDEAQARIMELERERDELRDKVDRRAGMPMICTAHGLSPDNCPGPCAEFMSPADAVGELRAAMDARPPGRQEMTEKPLPARVECPEHLLPNGATYSACDPEMLRLAAEAHNAASVGPHTIQVKAWVVLWLLERADAAAGLTTKEAQP